MVVQAAFSYLRGFVTSRRRTNQTAAAVKAASTEEAGGTTLHEFPDFLIPFLVQVSLCIIHSALLHQQCMLTLPLCFICSQAVQGLPDQPIMHMQRVNVWLCINRTVILMLA